VLIGKPCIEPVGSRHAKLQWTSPPGANRELIDHLVRNREQRPPAAIEPHLPSFHGARSASPEFISPPARAAQWSMTSERLRKIEQQISA
jgi:hypothetical protein